MANNEDPSKTVAVSKPMARGVSVPIQYPMLSETNYGIWAVKMKIVLRSLGVWAVIEGVEEDEEKDQGAMQRLTLLLERLLPVAVLLLALIGAPLMIFSRDGLPRLRGLERELASVEAENRDAQREIEELRGYVARLRDDPAAVERIARDDLGLMRQSEIVFQFAKK